jgi:hypothetical protein
MAETIMSLLSQHLAERFPRELGGEVISGIDLVLLDADVIACIQNSLQCSGELEDAKKAILKDCMKDLETVIPRLSASNNLRFERLKRMGEMVLGNAES